MRDWLKLIKNGNSFLPCSYKSLKRDKSCGGISEVTARRGTSN